MIHFVMRPDIAFDAIIKRSFEQAFDSLEDESAGENAGNCGFCEETSRCFSRTELLAEYKKLKKTYESSSLYRVTDYHYLILNDAIYQCVELHNDEVKCNGPQDIGKVCLGCIDMGLIEDIYFWDMDFQIPVDDFDRLRSDNKERMSFTPELFGVIHGMKPHGDEIMINKIDIPKDWLEPDDSYRCGEGYPYYNDDEAALL